MELLHALFNHINTHSNAFWIKNSLSLIDIVFTDYFRSL